jgi:hypothetical protein
MTAVTAPPSYQPPPWGGAGQIEAWLDSCEERLVHPARVEDHLRRSGWAYLEASRIGFCYRRRFNEHHLGYSVLLIATGMAALAAGSAGHFLVAGLSRPVNRNALAAWLTVLVCSLPFAVAAHRWAVRVDRDDPVAVWSTPRRALAQVLLWASGIVGIGRLMIYVGQLVARLVGARSGHNGPLVGDFLNVLIVVGIALPVWLWAFSFLHRFDGEDPTAPPSVRHRPER